MDAPRQLQPLRLLIERAQAGDDDAFGELFSRTQPRVELLIRLRLGERLRRRLDPEDVVQETFLVAYRSLSSFRAESYRGFAAWLARIADHVILRLHRYHHAHRRDASRERSLEDLTDPRDRPRSRWLDVLEDGAPSPSRLALRDERFERLARAIEELGEDRREVVILARIRELPMDEIARILERGRTACSMLLLRALRDLGRSIGATDSFGLPPRSLASELAPRWRGGESEQRETSAPGGRAGDPVGGG